MAQETNNAPLFVDTRDGSTIGESASLPTSTTTMVNDGSVSVSTMSKHIPMSVLDPSASTMDTQTIVSFMSKPYPIVHDKFSASDVSTTFSYGNVYPGHYLNQPIFKNKMYGNLYFKGTMIVRLQVNANRFQMGRYIMYWLPFTSSASYGALGTAQELRLRRNNLTTITQLPHVEIDLNCDTEAILEIPWINPASHFNFIDQTQSVGLIGLYPYSALQASSGPTTAEFTIFVSYKDVDIKGVTLSQSGIRRRVRGKNATELEQVSEGINGISSSLSKVSTAFDIWADVPLISSFAKPASWFADLASRTASVFGWSKPLDLSHVTRVTRTVFPYMSNVDAPDESFLIGMNSKNSVQALPGFAGSDLDEMSIDYIKTIPAYVRKFTMSTTDDVGTVLLSQFYLRPVSFTNATDTNGLTYYTNTPMGFLARLFEFYKGSIKITLKIVKTEFHSGRISVSYSPRNNTVSDWSNADAVYLHREIIDIRLGNEFTFVVPYTSNVPFRKCTQSYGVLNITVLNELVAPATVPSNIVFLMEMSAAPDMEFSVPRMHNMTPYGPYVAQSGLVPRNECQISATVLGGGSMSSDNDMSCLLINGEKPKSLLQLLKIFHVPVYATGLPATNKYQWIRPFAITFVNGDSAPSSLVKGVAFSDTFSLINLCYAMSRGGVRLKLMPSTGSTSDALYSVYHVQTTGATDDYIGAGSSFPVTTGNEANSFNALFRNSFSGGVEVALPQYQKTHSRVNIEQYAVGTNCYPNVSLTSNDSLFVVQNVTNNAVHTVYRAASDDFQLGLFVGIPPTLNE